MAQTLEQINALRSFKGDEMLTELPAETTTTEEKKENIDQAAASTETTPTENPTEIKSTAAVSKEIKEPTIVAPELTDDMVREFLKGKGIEVNSLEDLKAKEEVDPVKLKEQREAAKLSYALTKGLITTTEHNNFIRDSADPKQLVYAEYYTEAKKENAELTDEEIHADFLETYGLNAEPSTLKFKSAVKAVAVLGQEKLKEKYGKVFSIDAAYSQHETETANQTAYHKKIAEEAPKYKSAVEKVFANLPKFTVPFSDTESYEAEYPAEIVAEVKALMLEESTAKSSIDKGFDEINIQHTAEMILLKKSFTQQVKKIATEYLLNNQKGTHGLPVGDIKTAVATDLYPNMTPEQKKAMSYLTGQAEPVTN